ANELLGGQATAIYRSGGGGQRIGIATACGMEGNTATSASLPITADALRAIVGTRGVIPIPDVSKALTLTKGEHTSEQPLPFLIPIMDAHRAVLAIPILIQDKVYGGLFLYDTAPRTFSHEEMELGLAFADQVALTIANAQRTDQIKQTAVAAERH